MLAPLTGRKVFVITAAAFGVVIAVNVTLAVQAVRTFPGLEVKNSYVASQQFESDRAEQLSLGWRASAVVEGDELVLTLTGPDGAPVPDARVGGIFGRATSVRDDQSPRFTFDGTAYRAPIRAGAGNWNLRLEAEAPDGRGFHQRLVVPVLP